jgi:hypothetical protein
MSNLPEDQYEDVRMRLTEFGFTLSPRGGFIEGYGTDGDLKGYTVSVKLDQAQYDRFMKLPEMQNHIPSLNKNKQEGVPSSGLASRLELKKKWEEKSIVTDPEQKKLPTVLIKARKTHDEFVAGHGVTVMMNAAPDSQVSIANNAGPEAVKEVSGEAPSEMNLER